MRWLAVPASGFDAHERPATDILFQPSRRSKTRGLRALYMWISHSRFSPLGSPSPGPVCGPHVSHKECIFCVVNRPDLNEIFMENKTCYARYDNFPAAAGHIEVVPKRHVESFFEMSPREVADAYALLVNAQQKVSGEHNPDGYTIGINEGRAAGRTIDHVHIHLIPRNFGDVEDPRGGVRQVVPSYKYTPDDWSEADGHGRGERRG